MEITECFQASALFATIPQTALQEHIVPNAQVRKYTPGSYLIMPQDVVNHISLVLFGVVHILHIFSDGTYSLMNVLEPGEPLGADLVATKSQISPYYAVAASEVQIACLPEDLLWSVRIPAGYGQTIRDNLLKIISDENMKKEYRLAILSRNGLRERILAYLTMQAAKRGTSNFTIPFSREELAAYLCVNRSALSHELSLMRQEGLLDFRKNHFRLLCPGEGETL